ncbi:MAG: metallophosphoesterase [Bacteroidales bacterium]|jgi:predicted phosphohydrolase|nr:metallophosphoesterase [Bacteroidales bacterium]
MKIQYCSDLHLEFRENKEYLKTNPLKPTGEILVLAGDIVPFGAMERHGDFFDYLSKNFKYTYWVPGNHEYYYYDITQKSGFINDKIRKNVFLVNNTSVIHEDLKLIFTTLWTKITDENQFTIQRRMSDFHVINYKGESFKPFHYNQLHEESINFLRQELHVSDNKKIIVVTHHVPTFFSYPEIYRGDELNEGFGVELYDLIEKSNLDYWIFGHHHNNIKEFTIGNTKLLTNQLGYVCRMEHELFQSDVIFHT